jgi:hypothetical protein
VPRGGHVPAGRVRWRLPFTPFERSSRLALRQTPPVTLTPLDGDEGPGQRFIGWPLAATVTVRA